MVGNLVSSGPTLVFNQLQVIEGDEHIIQELGLHEYLEENEPLGLVELLLELVDCKLQELLVPLLIFHFLDKFDLSVERFSFLSLIKMDKLTAVSSLRWLLARTKG